MLKKIMATPVERREKGDDTEDKKKKEKGETKKEEKSKEAKKKEEKEDINAPCYPPSPLPPTITHSSTSTPSPSIQCTYCHKILKSQQLKTDHEKVCSGRPSSSSTQNAPFISQTKQRGNTHPHTAKSERSKKGTKKIQQKSHTPRDSMTHSHTPRPPPSASDLLSLLSSINTVLSSKFASFQTLAAEAGTSTTNTERAIKEAQTLFTQCHTRAELLQLKTHLYNMYRTVISAPAIHPDQKTDLLRQVDALDAQIVDELNSDSFSHTPPLSIRKPQ